MGSDPDREPPFFFCKPADAVICAPETIPYPPATSNLHYEVEQVVVLKSGGVNIKIRDAIQTVFGYAVGIDFTRRDMQVTDDYTVALAQPAPCYFLGTSLAARDPHPWLVMHAMSPHILSVVPLGLSRRSALLFIVLLRSTSAPHPLSKRTRLRRHAGLGTCQR